MMCALGGYHRSCNGARVYVCPCICPSCFYAGHWQHARCPNSKNRLCDEAMDALGLTPDMVKYQSLAPLKGKGKGKGSKHGKNKGCGSKHAKNKGKGSGSKHAENKGSGSNAWAPWGPKGSQKGYPYTPPVSKAAPKVERRPDSWDS